MPLARFVDRVLVHYPDIELVTEADLSVGSDPYRPTTCWTVTCCSPPYWAWRP